MDVSSNPQDLAAVTPVSRDIEILHPKTNQPTGLVIKLLPPSDPRVRKARNRAIQEQVLAQRRRVELTDDQKEMGVIKHLAAAVEGWEWRGDATFNGEKLSFNEKNVHAVLKVEWIRHQIDTELGDEAAFFPD